jgi:nitroreductase
MVSVEATLDPKVKTQLDLIFGRRSIRAFKPGPVTDAQVRIMLEAAMAAPSAVAKDPWRFVVVRNTATLNALADVLPNAPMLREAALGIIVCGDLQAAHDQQLSYMLQDCAAAVENLLLAAHALGLGTCWLGIHPRAERIQKVTILLGLPELVLPVAGVAVGWPGEQKEARTRYNEAYVHYEKW